MKHQPKDKKRAGADEEKQPLLYHLLALRKLLIACVIAVGVGFVVAFYVFCTPLMDFITEPIRARGVQIIFTTVSESLTTQLKVSLMAGVVLVSPFIFYQLWVFIKPALYPEEIRSFRALFLLALMLFLLGVFFCYRYVYQLAIDFFLVAGEDLATPMLSIDKYVGFLFGFLLPFGVVFEMPVAIYMAARKGWVSYQALAKNRKYVLFGIFVLAAILTPPDVISQIMLGIPMYLLYEVSVQVARFVKPREKSAVQSA